MEGGGGSVPARKDTLSTGKDTVSVRSCGPGGPQVARLGIGCWSFGGGEYWGPQDEQDVATVVRQALDREINYFDTAEMYNDGRSEESLGRALRGVRHRALIGTKVIPGNMAPEELRVHCEESLRRLSTDYIDIYMIHWPPAAERMPDALAAMTALQAEGKIRWIGVSNFGGQQLRQALETGAQIALDQLCYNLITRAIEFEILPLCREQGIALFTYMPLLQGLLAGCFATPDEVPPVLARTRHFRGNRPGSRHGEAGAEAETFAAINQVTEIARREGVTIAELALAWVAAHADVTCVLAGARTPAQLDDDIRGVSLPLRGELVAELDRITEPLKLKLGPSPDLYEASDRSRIR